MRFFVSEDSIVRRIWGKSDTVLFIFAGASAEFALNKAVDWLYFTGQLPADPLARLFSTVAYSGKIVFLPYQKALAVIDNITNIHTRVEKKRGEEIPQWAYRDVLFLLIAYSINAFELLERELSEAEKEEVFDVFYRVGVRMGIRELPKTYREWLPQREEHMKQDLKPSKYTKDLYRQYRKHLGPVRYWLLLQVQQLVCPKRVHYLLGLKSSPVIPPALATYKLSRLLGMDSFLKSFLLPTNYKQEIRELDRY